MAPCRKEKIISAREAAAFVRDGMTIAIGGFINSAHPMPLVREIIRRNVHDLIVVGPSSSGLDLDLLVAAGCARKLVSCYFGAERLAPISPVVKRAAQRGDVEIFECDEGMYYAGLHAGAQRLPFLPTRAGVGTSYPQVNTDLRVFRDPIKNEELIAVPAIRPDVALLYAGYSDVYANVQHVGTSYGDRALYRASEKTLVCVEKIISNEEIRKDPAKTSIPGADAVVRTPFGSHPFASPGFYLTDEGHLREYLAGADALVKNDDAGPMQAYLEKYIYGPEDHMAYLEAVGLRRLFSLSEY